jgi:NAD(P)H-hydrate epimerase
LSTDVKRALPSKHARGDGQDTTGPGNGVLYLGHGREYGGREGLSEDDVSVIPTVTVAQMREVDRIMVDELHIELLQMMENAGRCLAVHTRSWLSGQLAGRQVVVLAGSGGNGGGGLVAARRLTIWGAAAAVVLGQPRSEVRGVPAHQLEILGRMGVPVWTPEQFPPDALAHADAILDALIGYSLQGPPREPIASLIRAANRAHTPVIALDIPSGLDGDSGRPFDPAITAATTLTLALPKAGLLRPAAREWVGDLYLADISVPVQVYQRLGVETGPIFAASDIVPVPLDGTGEPA